MKNPTVLLLAALLLLLAPLPAMAGPQATLQGEITQTADGQFTLHDDIYGDILVAYGEATAWEGLSVPQIGQFVTVQYNGIMTRSLPHQVQAQRVTMHVLDGEVLLYDENRHALLLETPAMGQVLVLLPEDAKAFAPGDFVTAAYDGIMTRSNPSQVSAYAVTRHERIEGIITAIGDGYVMLSESESAMCVNVDGNTRQYGALSVGESVAVYYSGLIMESMPPQIYGEIITGMDIRGEN